MRRQARRPAESAAREGLGFPSELLGTTFNSRARGRGGNVMRISLRFSVVLGLILSAVLSGHLCARAQSTATLTGTLTDPSGAAVARAAVSAERLPAPGNLQRATSGDDGRFTLSLAPGKYRVGTTHQPFPRVEEDQALTAAETPELRIRPELERPPAPGVVSPHPEPAAGEAIPAPVSAV